MLGSTGRGARCVGLHPRGRLAFYETSAKRELQSQNRKPLRKASRRMDSSENDHEKAAIELLICDRQPWTVEKNINEVSSTRLDAIDAVGRLVGSRLLHRHGEFVGSPKFWLHSAPRMPLSTY